MGMRNLAGIASELARAGLAADTPAAVIEAGTTARQRTITGSLGDIAAKSIEAGANAPAVIVIGDVVALRAATGDDISERFRESVSSP